MKSTDGGYWSAKQGRSLSLDGWPVCKVAYQRSENLHSSESQRQPKGQGVVCGATLMLAMMLLHDTLTSVHNKLPEITRYCPEVLPEVPNPNPNPNPN